MARSGTRKKTITTTRCATCAWTPFVARFARGGASKWIRSAPALAAPTSASWNPSKKGRPLVALPGRAHRAMWVFVSRLTAPHNTRARSFVLLCGYIIWFHIEFVWLCWLYVRHLFVFVHLTFIDAFCFYLHPLTFHSICFYLPHAYHGCRPLFILSSFYLHPPP